MVEIWLPFPDNEPSSIAQIVAQPMIPYNCLNLNKEPLEIHFPHSSYQNQPPTEFEPAHYSVETFEIRLTFQLKSVAATIEIDQQKNKTIQTNFKEQYLFKGHFDDYINDIDNFMPAIFRQQTFFWININKFEVY